MHTLLMLPAFISILLLAFALKRRLDCDGAFAPLLAVETVMLSLILLGLFGLLRAGALAVLAAGIAWGAYEALRDKKAFAAFLTSPALLAFAAGCVLLAALYTWRDSFYYYFDDYSHWGPFFKWMFTTDRLHIFYDSAMFHPTYPQAVQVFYYFLAQFVPAFSEAHTYVALGVGLTACGTTLTAGCEERGWSVRSGLVALCVPLFFVLFPFCDAYNTVYFDAVMGAMFGAGAVMAISFCEIRWQNTVAMAITLAAISQVKTTGFVFALVCLAVFFFMQLLAPEEGLGLADTLKKNLPRAWRHILAAAAAFALMFLVWKLALLLTGKNVDQFNQNMFGYGSFTQEISAALAGQNERVSTVWSSFVHNFLYTPVVYNGYGSGAVVLGGFSAVAAVLGVWLWRKKAQRGVCIALCLMPAFYFCYLFTLFYTYVCHMSYMESVLNASYARYVSSFMIGWVMAVLAAVLVYGDGFLGVKKQVWPCLAAVAVLALQANAFRTRDALNLNQTREEVARPFLESASAQMAGELQAGDRVLALVNNNIIYRYIFRFMLYPVDMTLEAPTSFAGMSEADIAAAVEEHGIDYIFFYIADENTENYKHLFSDGLAAFFDTEKPCLYKVEQTDTGVRFDLVLVTEYNE